MRKYRLKTAFPLDRGNTHVTFSASENPEFLLFIDPIADKTAVQANTDLYQYTEIFVL